MSSKHPAPCREVSAPLGANLSLLHWHPRPLGHQRPCSRLLWQLGSHSPYSPECPSSFHLWKLHSVFKALLNGHLLCKPSPWTRPLTLGRKSSSLLCFHGSLLRPNGTTLEKPHRGSLRARPPPPDDRRCAPRRASSTTPVSTVPRSFIGERSLKKA